MRRAAGPALRLLLLPTLGLVAAVAVLPDRAGEIAHVYLVVAAALVLSALLVRLARSLRAPERSIFEDGLARPVATPGRIQQLDRLEREVTLGRQSALDFRRRLQVTLRTIARGLLAQRGVDLDRDPARAAAVLGPEAWALVAPEPAAFADWLAGGVDAPALDRAISSLERLAWS